MRPIILCPVTAKRVYGTVGSARELLLPGWRIYRCEFCGWLHLTSHPKREMADGG